MKSPKHLFHILAITVLALLGSNLIRELGRDLGKNERSQLQVPPEALNMSRKPQGGKNPTSDPGVSQPYHAAHSNALAASSPSAGRRRVRIHSGTGKYPLLRTVEESEGNGKALKVSTMVADHLLVPTSPNAHAALHAFVTSTPGLSIRKILNGGDLVLLRFPEPESPDAMDLWLDRLRDAGFTHAGPDYLQKTSAAPNDPEYPKLWGLNNTGQINNGSGGTSDADIDAPEAWDVTTGSSGVIVAVIDSGVDYTHTDLAANMWTDNSGKHGYDSYDGDSEPQDENGHGTHVAGTIAAVGNNGIGVTGVAWNAKIMSCRFIGPDGQGATSDAISAIRYAVDHGARILNNSWGSSSGSVGDALHQEITRARSLGVLFIAAAGNLGQGEADETRNNDSFPSFPANYPDDNIISVAATDHTDSLASFSHYGATKVHIAAPGKDIYSTARGSTYQYMSGTSMAAPHVSGAAAMILAAGPGMTYSQIRSRLLNHADAKSGLSGKLSTGARLNLHRSIQDLAGPLLRLASKTAVERSGNADAYVNPGESHAIDLVLENTGSLAASNCIIQASLSSGAPATINRTTFNAGNLAPSQKASWTNAFEITFQQPDTFPKKMVVTFTLSASGVSTTWSDSLEITIQKSTVIRGSVTRASTNQALANATVIIQGPVSAQVQTDSSGHYVLHAVTGAYQLTASYPGMLASETFSLSASAQEAVRDFKLGTTDLSFQPDALRLMIPPGRTRSTPVLVMQNGDTPRTLPIQTRITGTALARDHLYGIHLDSPEPGLLELDPATGRQLSTRTISPISSNYVLGMACSGQTLWILYWPSFNNYQLVPVSTSTWTIGTPVPLSFRIVQGVGSANGHIVISSINLATGNPEIHTYHPSTAAFARIGDLPSYGTGPIVSGASRKSYFMASYESVSELNEGNLAQIRNWSAPASTYITSLAYLDGSQSVYTASEGTGVRKHHPDNGTTDTTFAAPAGIRHVASSSASGPAWISSSVSSSEVPPLDGRFIPLEISTLGMTAGQTFTATLSIESPFAAPLALDVQLSIGDPPDGSKWEGWFEKTHHRLPNPSDAAQDGDHDGMPDFLQYATGGELGVPGLHTGRPVVSISEEPPMMMMKYSLRKSLNGSQVTPEISEDLVRWRTLPGNLPGATVNRTSLNTEFDQVRISIPITGTSAYLRLKGAP